MANLTTIQVSRSFSFVDDSLATYDLFAFADASDVAIGYALYAHATTQDGRVKVTLLAGAAKVAPRTATSIPRLELCAAVIAAEAINTADLALADTKFVAKHHFTDSSIVHGYLANTSRWFS